MKEKRTYKRFELISFLAIVGCAGMLLFECIFIFELYDRGALEPQTQAAPSANQPVVTPVAEPARNEISEPVRREPIEPVRHEPVEPADVPPATIEAAPAAKPVG